MRPRLSTIATIASLPQLLPIHPLCPHRLSHHSCELPPSLRVLHPPQAVRPTVMLDGHLPECRPTGVHPTTTRRRSAIGELSSRMRTMSLSVLPHSTSTFLQPLHAIIVPLLALACHIRRMRRRTRRLTVLQRERWQCQCSCQTTLASDRICSLQARSRLPSKSPSSQMRMRFHSRISGVEVG